MSDVVKKLRKGGQHFTVESTLSIMHTAADEIERLHDLVQKHYSNAINLDADLAKANAKLAAAEKDAERYRLLRRVTSEPALVELLEYLDNNPDTPEKFDAFIDAAIAKEKE